MEFYFDKCYRSNSWDDFKYPLLHILRKTPLQAESLVGSHIIMPTKIIESFEALMRHRPEDPEVKSDVVIRVLVHASLIVDDSPEWRLSVMAVQPFSDEQADDNTVRYLQLRKAGFNHEDTESPSSTYAYRALEGALYRHDMQKSKAREDEAVLRSFMDRVTHLLEADELPSPMELRLLATFSGSFDLAQGSKARRLYCEHKLAREPHGPVEDLVRLVGFTTFDLCGHLTPYAERLTAHALSVKLDNMAISQHPLVQALLEASAHTIRSKCNSGAVLTFVEYQVVQSLNIGLPIEVKQSAVGNFWNHFREPQLDVFCMNAADIVFAEFQRAFEVMFSH